MCSPVNKEPKKKTSFKANNPSCMGTAELHYIAISNPQGKRKITDSK